MLKCLIFVLLNVVFFVIFGFPKQLIQLVSASSVLAIVYTIAATLLSLILYVVYSIIFSLYFNKNKALSTQGLFEKKEKLSNLIDVKKTGLFIGVSLAFDLLIAVCIRVFSGASYYLNDLLIVFQWIAVYLIFSNKDMRFISDKRKTVKSAIVVVILLAVSIAGGFFIAQEYNRVWNEIYTAGWFKLIEMQEYLNNLDKIYSFKTFILDSLVGVIFITTHLGYCKEKCAKNNGTIKETE